MNGRLLEVISCHAYFGIGINNKLCLAEHFDNTVSKENKVLGLLYQFLYNCFNLIKKPFITHWLDGSWNTVEVVDLHITRSTKISLNRFNIKLPYLSLEAIDAKCIVPDMLREFNWKTIEDRSIISKLDLLKESVHNIVTI